MKTALITGVSGQDGSYLAKWLLSKGYRVIGLVRNSEGEGLWRLKFLDIAAAVELIECDLTDMSQLFRVVQQIQPQEIYHYY
jgi:GDPmannose 4,6-dehydratase